MRRERPLTGLLAEMAASSAERARVEEARISHRELRTRIADLPPSPSLDLSPEGFDLIAEIKLRAPSAGALADSRVDPRLFVEERAHAYAAGGAAALSILTEPTRFDGSTEHLRAATAAVKLPVMRKDFLVSSYQLLEARAAGAAGALLIIRMLDDPHLIEMRETAADAGLFLLLEAFDQEDLDRAGALLMSAPAGQPPMLVGLNTRDLSTLAVDETRLEALAHGFPHGAPRVAESGVLDPAGAARAASLGYDMVLVGTALMRAPDPAALVAGMLATGRAAKAEA